MNQLKPFCKKKLKDKSSDAKSYLPVIINKDAILTEPDGVLIKEVIGQRKCDYLIFVPSAEQTDFIELKGVNISSKKDKSPHDQICQTIDYLINDENLKELVIGKEKHAFIVSPKSQKIPDGIDSEERKLYQKLALNGTNKKYNIADLIHYVRVVPKAKFSCNGKIIICDNSNGIPIPYDIGNIR